MTINVKSIDPLQVTMTKACLEVLTNLGKVHEEISLFGFDFEKYFDKSEISAA